MKNDIHKLSDSHIIVASNEVKIGSEAAFGQFFFDIKFNHVRGYRFG
jgi:hypothetical protein